MTNAKYVKKVWEGGILRAGTIVSLKDLTNRAHSLATEQEG